MPDYAKMYKRLFQAQTQAIEILQKAQQDTEEMYISAPEPEIRILGAKNQAEDKTADKTTEENSSITAAAARE